MPDMTGQPGCQTMETFGGSTASYLARTPRIPLFVLVFIGLETKNARGGRGALLLYSGPFAWSYSVSKKVYTKGVFSVKTQLPQQAKKRLVYTKQLVFKGKRRKIHVHQGAFKMFVGDPFAQYWCIDFGLLFVSLCNGLDFLKVNFRKAPDTFKF